MSDKLPMMDVEKSKLQLVVPALVRALMERLADSAGLSVNEYGNALLSKGLRTIPTTQADIDRANEIIQNNIAKREELKAKKGIR